MKKFLTVTATSIVALAMLGSPAFARDHGGDRDGGYHEGWHRGGPVHEVRDDWRWHHGYYRPYAPVYYRAYAPAPVYYAPQPVAYYPQPAGLGLSFFIR